MFFANFNIITQRKTKMFKNNFIKCILLIFALIFLNCKTYKNVFDFSETLESGFYQNQFTGILVCNPHTNDTIFSYNAEKYFTPASNTKIFTLFTALKLLPETIPSFKYSEANDTLTILGTGDPAFLHPVFNDSTALKMAENYKHVNVLFGNIEDEKFGPGWAWEDYDTYFSPERSSLPMYGNVVTISNVDSLRIYPKSLFNNVKLKANRFRRDYNNNVFYYNPLNKNSQEIPVVINSELIAEFWEDLAPNKISIKAYKGEKLNHIAYSIPSDSLYRRMMEVSDNFLAEQMLILASSTLSDTLSSAKVRKYMLDNYLNDLKQEPRWVDGSGLSRYNLFSPTSFVQVLTKLYEEIPRERLFNLFPVGGRTGTLKNYYSGETEPYIYAKSGTVGNNYSLSGYLLTNSGETLIFSFMNNHYRQSTHAVKLQMQSFFEALRNQY